tara:strand:- start:2032 stop:2559 length:528 start_codon:yes stop_codon:yes gene_type:complete
MNKALIIVDMFEHGEQSLSFLPFIKYVCKKERRKGTKVIFSYADKRIPPTIYNWNDYDVICKLKELPQVVLDNKINTTYFGGLHWGHCVLQHAFRLDSIINGIDSHWKYLSGHLDWKEIQSEDRQVKVDCLNFVLNLTMTHPDERINGWNQIFSMMKEYDKKYYLWSDKNGFEEL